MTGTPAHILTDADLNQELSVLCKWRPRLYGLGAAPGSREVALATEQERRERIDREAMASKVPSESGHLSRSRRIS